MEVEQPCSAGLRLDKSGWGAQGAQEAAARGGSRLETFILLCA